MHRHVRLRCVGELAAWRPYLLLLPLTVYNVLFAMAEFTIQPTNVAVDVNGQAQFNCAISALNPALQPPFLSWSFIPPFSSKAIVISQDDEVLDREYVGQVQVSASTVTGSFIVSLAFRDVQFSHAGTYRCSSLHKNSANGYRDAELVVLGPKSMYAYVSETLVSLACAQNYSGLLTPVLQWTDRDDRLLSAINFTTVQYVIYNVTLPYRSPVLFGIQLTCWTRFHRPESELPNHASNLPDYEGQNLTWTGLEPHKNDNVRLVDGSSTSEGRFEVFINGSWGIVCDEAFDFRAAMVVCRQLGLSGGKVMDFGKGKRPVAMTSVKCSGNEATIMLCDSEYVRETAISDEKIHHMCSTDVGIQCSSEEETVLGIRLGDSYNPAAGRVEVFVNNEWGSVCDDGFNDIAARIACHQLGYSGGVVDLDCIPGLIDIALDDLGCRSTDNRLQDCSTPQQIPYVTDCNNHEDAGVVCSLDNSLAIQIPILPWKTFDESNDGQHVLGRSGIFYFQVTSCSGLNLYLLPFNQSMYIRIQLFHVDYVEDLFPFKENTFSYINRTSVHNILECDLVKPCQVLVTESMPYVDMSCHEFLPLWLLWSNSSIAVVKSLPRFDGKDPTVAVISQLIETSDALMRWKMSDPTDWISFIQFGTEHHEAIVRVYRNASLYWNRCFLSSMEISSIQICGDDWMDEDRCRRCGCCYDASLTPKCYLSKAFDVSSKLPDFCNKDFKSVIGSTIIINPEVVLRNDKVGFIIMLQNIVRTVQIRIFYNDGSGNDLVTATDFESPELLPSWATEHLIRTNLTFDSVSYHRASLSHTFRREAQYHVVIYFSDSNKPSAYFTKDAYVDVMPRTPIPVVVKSSFLVNSGPVEMHNKTEIVLLLLEINDVPEIHVKLDLKDGNVTEMRFNDSFDLPEWVTSKVKMLRSVVQRYHRARVIHPYASSGIYMVEATVTAPKWNYPYEAFVLQTVLIVKCQPPIPVMRNAGTSKQAIAAYPFDQVITVSVDLKQDCNIPQDMSAIEVVWVLYPLKSLEVEKSEANAILLSPMVSNTKEIKANPYSIDPGFYIIKAKTLIPTVNQDEKLSLETEGWIAVYVSSLKAARRKSFSVSTNETVLLDIPPDNEKVKLWRMGSTLVYLWTCEPGKHAKMKPVNNEMKKKLRQSTSASVINVDNCFQSSATPVPSNAQVLIFEAHTLKYTTLPATFTFMWMATTIARFSPEFSETFVTVVSDPPVAVEIVCISNCEANSFVNTASDIVLEAQCTSCLESDGLLYEWELHITTRGGIEFQISNWESRVEGGLKNSTVRVNAGNLSDIESGFLFSLTAIVSKVNGLYGSRVHRLIIAKRLHGSHGNTLKPQFPLTVTLLCFIQIFLKFYFQTLSFDQQK